MKVFLTYASEQKAIAEAAAFSLRSRGYDVFLDKDDLPPGRSYDEQIEMGIKASDYLVFLISPQSVQQGRYTRTELEYARRKWRHPDGRILPVMVQPTAMADVPEFLRAVTILEPKGNIAAEIGAHVAATETLDARNLMLWFVGAAAVSGGLSHLSMLARMGPVLLGENPFPGLFFGLALCAPLFWRLSVPLLRIVIVLVAIQVSWQLAVQAAMIAERHTTLRSKDIPTATDTAVESMLENKDVSKDRDESLNKIPKGISFEPNLVIPGLIGGLVGAFGTWLAMCAASSKFRQLDVALLTTMVGGGTGMLLAATSIPKSELLILFLVWQISVAASLAYSITRAK
jgi:hypothetical protein